MDILLHDKTLAAENLAELLAGTALKGSGISDTSREGQVFTVAKLHYVNGVVYYAAEHPQSELEHLALHCTDTTKSGNVKHPLVRVRTLVRLAVGLGLLNLEKQKVKITDLGQAYYEARGDDKWALTEKQQKILCSHILSDPYRSDTVYAITALFKLYKDGYRGEELSGQYANEIGKGDVWKSPVTYEGFTKFGLSYIAELGLMDVHEDELLIKSLVVERHYQDKVNIVKPINLPSGKLPKPKAKAASITERYPSNPRVSKSALVSAAFKCELDPSHTTFLNHVSKQQHMEAHHLIPMKCQDDFENALDVPENILSLCPNCHRKIHLADNYERVIAIEQAYDLKKEALPSRGLSVSIAKLLTFYGGPD
ncbi:HNH endonuclease [Geomonas subterranea]|uniref:HNH endonuclease n=2 Tax=Geomonas subterranea TaxID=2847989 RepID=A0ABX8LNA1_9BACT|nr:HNH endonuclease [Geomonas subterranea]QXE92801.1 HNH endonuclease [Geomonas subterranea]